MTIPALALQTPPQTTDLGRLGDLWQAAEELRFVAAFTFDHLVPLQSGERPGSTHAGPRRGVVLDGWMTAAVLAQRTTRLQVGTLVSGVTYRPAGQLAKLAVTLDHATAGRAVLGVGAGWHRQEHAMFGLPFPARAERLVLLRETVEAFRLLCDREVTSYEGRHVSLRDAVFEPKPVRPGGIPVLIGGSSDAVVDLAGTLADVYNGFQPADAWSPVHARLDRAATTVGRCPDLVRRSAFVTAELSGAPVTGQGGAPAPGQAGSAVTGLAGDDAQLGATLRAYGNAGVDMLVVAPGDAACPEGLARLAAVRASMAAADD